MILAFYSPVVGQVLAIVFSLLLAVLFIKPRLVVFLYFLFRIILQPHVINQVQLFGIAISSYLSFGIVFAALTSILYARGKGTLFPRYMWPLALLGIISLISIIYSIERAYTGNFILRYVSGLCIGIICYNIVNSRDDFVNFIKDVCKIAWIPVLFGIYQKITGFYFPWKELMYSQYEMGYRVSSLFAMYNEFGIYLSIIILCTIFAIIVAESRRERIKHIILLILSVLTLLFSLNRGSWIALGFAILVSMFFFWRFLKIRYFILAGIAGSFVAAPIIINRFYDLVNPSSWGVRHDTFSGRIQSWDILSGFGFERFFSGWGAGTSLALTKLKLGVAFAPHNDYLRIFIEFGFFGLLVFTIFLLKTWLLALRHRKSKIDWPVHMLAFSVYTYYIVISVAQNLIYNLIIFPLFLLITSCYIKFLSLPPDERHIFKTTSGQPAKDSSN